MSPDPTVLAFDTSVAHCAAALLCGGRIIAQRHEEMAKGQAERLIPLLEEVLADAALGWSDLGRIACGIGPGNFTGIRMSVSAARGLALSLGIPAVGVSSLAAQAHGLSGPVLSSLDARRGALYLQVFGPETPPVMCSGDTLPDLAMSRPSCVGHDSAALAAHYGGCVVAPPYPLAHAIAFIGATAPGDTRPAPLYLRAPDAAPPRDPAPVILP
ncbi:tRNA (adenosine(37)-N6)-threonylcarbamoyltransferase complex dimerization subunit type 1 TsaB [Oceaniglobus trochenteri]|uniref:tRNA (adenosine(37)-N6)-threonylcarbamoyltransferase complex dimerization subunit type 1 TsaB n=1 Tax=Oceaniglobus trochenteri TaxID=2763260 RepID=UPI001CFF594A|nr:tRNA (adenosine(37)-N6)-threonylcarbamoyltransferase complex dimerization subunit type 1 TsaB [Oceaniglobus trochenteri]